MVKGDKRQNVMWMSPSPLWAEQSAWMRLPMQSQMTQPIVLRFANDMFMDEMIAMLTHSPWRFEEWIAREETWRNPMPSPKPVEITRPNANLANSYNKTKRLVQNHSREKRVAQIKSLTKIAGTVPLNFSSEPIKLYHATHQRYYVVTASLISEEKGYPDYRLNLSSNEKAAFVVRALVENDNKSCDEYGYVSTPSGMAWKKVGVHENESAAVQRIIPNEEKLSLFPVTYPDRCERFRQILGGLIPVGKRDEWINAPSDNGTIDVEIASPVPSYDGGVDHLREILYSDVIAPWKAMIDQAETEKRKNSNKDTPFPNLTWDEESAKRDKIRIMRTARDEIQTSSWYVLLDFSRFLKEHLPRVWKKIDEKSSAPLSNIDENALVDILMGTKMDSRLFIELAVENLAVGGFVSDTGVSLWDSLLDFWKLEIYLKLSWVLHESGNHLNTLKNSLVSYIKPLNGIPIELRSDFESYLRFIDDFQRKPDHTFFDFAQELGETFDGIKKAAVLNLLPSKSEQELIKILRGISIPIIRLNDFNKIEIETSGAAQIEKTMWGLLSFYWSFEEKIIGTLNLSGQNIADKVADKIAEYLHSDNHSEVKDLSEQLLDSIYGKDISCEWYSFVQFANDIENHCPLLYDAALGEAFNKIPSIDVKTKELISLLESIIITDAVHNDIYYPNKNKRNITIVCSLADALIKIPKWDKSLEAVDKPYDRNLPESGDESEIDSRWPDFLFPLADPEPLLKLEQSHIVPGPGNKNPNKLGGAESLQKNLDDLAELIDKLVGPYKEQSGSGKSSSLNMKPFLKKKNPRFVVRFVFERPHCGNLFQPLVSKATCQFEMAPFFDPDAPARPVRITMPVDISPAGLRKYKKNAMFLFSDMMCGKVKKTKKLTLADLVLSVLPWPFHKDLPDIGNTGPCSQNGETFGMFCSLSIPIVTLCAMVLLFIMVNLFNIFFKWIPWFFICFPLPGLSNLKGKDND